MTPPPHTLCPPDGLLPLAYPSALQGLLGALPSCLLGSVLGLFFLYRWTTRRKAAVQRAHSVQRARSHALHRLLALRRSHPAQEVFLTQLWACWALYVEATGLRLAYTLHEWPGLLMQQPLPAQAAQPFGALLACAGLWDSARFGAYTLSLHEREQLWQAFHGAIQAEVLAPLVACSPIQQGKGVGACPAFAPCGLPELRPAGATAHKGGCHVALGL